MRRFKIYVGHKAAFAASSLERAKRLAERLLASDAMVRIEEHVSATPEVWVYNATTRAWERRERPAEPR